MSLSSLLLLPHCCFWHLFCLPPGTPTVDTQMMSCDGFSAQPPRSFYHHFPVPESLFCLVLFGLAFLCSFIVCLYSVLQDGTGPAFFFFFPWLTPSWSHLCIAVSWTDFPPGFSLYLIPLRRIGFLLGFIILP